MRSRVDRLKELLTILEMAEGTKEFILAKLIREMIIDLVEEKETGSKA